MDLFVWYFHFLAQDRKKNISVKYIGEHCGLNPQAAKHYTAVCLHIPSQSQ